MAKRKPASPAWALMRSTAAMTAGLAVAQIAAAATAFRPPHDSAGPEPANHHHQAIDAIAGLYCGAEVELARAEAAAARAAAGDAEAAAALGRASAAKAEAGDGQMIEGDFSAYAGDDLMGPPGHGILAHQNGEVYVGAYCGLAGRNGPGVGASTNGWRYAGLWQIGAPTGPGVSVFEAKQEFAGKRDSAGVIAYPDGAIYAGGVTGGHDAPASRDGPGVLWGADGQIVHDGMWRADQPA